MAHWLDVYLAPALKRFGKLVKGHDLTVRDLFNMQLTCAYELVSLGGSEFCQLFDGERRSRDSSKLRRLTSPSPTESEWRGFEYAHDIMFFDIFSFGQPAQAALGLVSRRMLRRVRANVLKLTFHEQGWVQEWLARVTNTPITEFNSTTNSSYHTPDLFPLDQSIYVDATHDTIISAVITTLNFTSFAASGPLPSDHIPVNLSFKTSSISPFAANLHSQIVSCDGKRLVRWILNDGVVPLEHITECEETGVEGAGSGQGWCGLTEFVSATRERANSISFAYDCCEFHLAPPRPQLTSLYNSGAVQAGSRADPRRPPSPSLSIASRSAKAGSMGLADDGADGREEQHCL